MLLRTVSLSLAIPAHTIATPPRKILILISVFQELFWNVFIRVNMVQFFNKNIKASSHPMSAQSHISYLLFSRRPACWARWCHSEVPNDAEIEAMKADRAENLMTIVKI